MFPRNAVLFIRVGGVHVDNMTEEPVCTVCSQPIRRIQSEECPPPPLLPHLNLWQMRLTSGPTPGSIGSYPGDTLISYL